MAKSPPPGRVRPFADVLLELDRGRLHDDLGASLRELVEAVHTQGGAGALTLKIDLKGDTDDTVKVAGSFTVKAPKGKAKEHIFFLDAEANLTRHNPAQARLPLREAPAGEPDEQISDESMKAARSSR